MCPQVVRRKACPEQSQRVAIKPEFACVCMCLQGSDGMSRWRRNFSLLFLEVNSFIFSHNKQMRLITLTLESLHLVSHHSTIVAWSVYLMSTVFLLFWSISWIFAASTISMYHDEEQRVHVSPWRALCNNISSFFPLKPGMPPAENPLLHSTVVEQCVLTGCTAVSPPPPSCAKMPTPVKQYLWPKMLTCSF